MTDDLLTDESLRQVRSLRRVAGAGGVFAATVSMAANVYASDGSLVGWIVGATAPAAFIFAEILSTRGLPGRRSRLSLARTAIAACVVVGAGIVSFSHLSEVVRSVGESGLAAILLPLLVDGVVLCGILTMHDTSGQLRAHEVAQAGERAEARAAEVEAEAVRRAGEQAESLVPQDVQTRPVAQRERTGSPRDRGQEIAAKIKKLAADQPELTQAEIGEIVGRSERTVRRYLAEADEPPSEPTGSDDDGSSSLTVVA